MNLKKDILKLKKQKALQRCFEKFFFDISPINNIHGIKSYPNKRILRSAHGIHFISMPNEMREELERLAKEAIDYKAPWWKIF